MAFVNGIGFLIIFGLEICLTIMWIKKFKLFECYKPNTVSFHFYARWFLCLFPLLASMDNLRLFIGSIASESFASSNGWKNYYIFISMLHLVLLPLFVIECAIFSTTPKTKPIDINKYSSTNRLTMDAMFNQSSSKLNCIIWSLAWIITLTLCSIGLYAWITFIPHCSLSVNYNVYRWEIDDSLDMNFIQTLGEQQPVFVVVFTLMMNFVIWIRYKYWISFLLTLSSGVGMGLLAMLWKTGFFYLANFFEFTLLLSYYALDVFMYWLDDRNQTNDQGNLYYPL